MTKLDIFIGWLLGTILCILNGYIHNNNLLNFITYILSGLGIYFIFFIYREWNE